MNWDDLRAFLALRRAGTFAAAGRELGVNATTVARRLTALEESLGSQLFARTRDGLVPTAAGDEIAGSVELIERQTQLIERSVSGGDSRLAGRVRLNGTHLVMVSFLVDHLGAFRSRHPDIEIELNTNDAMIDLSRGEADLVVRHRLPDTGPGVDATAHVEVIAQRMSPIGIAVYASRGYLERAGVPPDPFAVDGHDVILPTANLSALPGASWSQAVESRGRGELRSDSVQAMAAACAAGFGLCALPCVAAAAHDNVLRVSDNVDSRDTWLLYPADLRRVARVRALRDFLVEVFETWGPLLSGEVTPADRDARATG